MHKLTFHPLGNADCCRIDLHSGKKLLFDYAATRDPDDDDDRRCDLPQLLRDDLENVGRDYYDVLAFTHLDEDHYKGASQFFWLEHAAKYQGDGRIKIQALWVPAAVITEDGVDHEEGRILQREARYRFKKGEGIRVFSRPDRLRDWCKKNEVDFDARKHLITDAGQLVPDFDNKREHGVEFFVHSPFAKRLNDGGLEDRNDDSLVLHATFHVEGVDTRLLLMADMTHEVLSDIVGVTRSRARAERLDWEVAKLPHHCSYLSLGPDKGEDKTIPVDNVRALYEEHRSSNAMIVSTSKPIPVKGSEEDEDPCPPHRQAANYYKGILDDEGDFYVTMEHPSTTNPEPIVIEIDSAKARVRKHNVGAPFVAVGTRTPRAG